MPRWLLLRPPRRSRRRCPRTWTRKSPASAPTPPRSVVARPGCKLPCIDWAALLTGLPPASHQVLRGLSAETLQEMEERLLVLFDQDNSAITLDQFKAAVRASVRSRVSEAQIRAFLQAKADEGRIVQVRGFRGAGTHCCCWMLGRDTDVDALVSAGQ